MKNRDTIENFIARTAEAARLIKASHITIMMQAADTDPLSFGSVVRVDDLNPFSNDGEQLTRTAKASSFLRSRAAAHQAAERVIHMADLNRNPEFVNAYLKVHADGTAILHVHCGIGLTTRIFKEDLSLHKDQKSAASA